MAETPSSCASTLMVRKRSTSSERPIWRSISFSAAGGQFKIHQRVVGLPVLVDPVGEGLQSPVLDPADRCRHCGDDALVLLDKGIDLLLRQILPGKEHMFVKCHCSLPFVSRPCPVPAAKASATSLDPRTGAREERRMSRRSRAETREAEALSASRERRQSLRPSVQPPAGPADCGGSYRGWAGKATPVGDVRQTARRLSRQVGEEALRPSAACRTSCRIAAGGNR